jgi:hypothetical protein
MAVDKETEAQVFGAPIPGESLTQSPKNMPYEKPPQFYKLEEAMSFLFNQLLEPQYFKQLMKLLDAGMSVEAVVRTILFGGFTMGKWTPDLAMLMYKPLMLTIVTLAKAAGLKHTPLVMKESLDKFLQGRFKQGAMFSTAKGRNKLVEEVPMLDQLPSKNNGFVQRRA